MSKKIYPQAVLKNLPESKQAEIIRFLDGPPEGGEKAHSISAGVNWLREDGISTSERALSLFRSWWLLRRQIEINAEAAREMVAAGKEQGWLKTAEDEMAAGQVFFTRLAMTEEDNLGFVRILREQTRRRQAETDREKFEFNASEACLKVLPQIKTVAADNTMDASAKIDKVRQLLFGEIAE